MNHDEIFWSCVEKDYANDCYGDEGSLYTS